VKIVAVTWNDAHSGDGDWKELPEAYEPCLVTSVGYIQEYEGGVVVIANLCPNMPEAGALCFGVTHIPTSCIVSMEILKEKRSESTQTP
jgi:hypothetical protein